MFYKSFWIKFIFRRSAIRQHIMLAAKKYKLLRVLSDAGDYVSRENLIMSVWGADVDGGVLNVYVHYLREKLERGGEKIILSSRKEGYRINEKYLGGCENA